MMDQRRSTSQRRTFRSCGYKYMQHYQQGWRAKEDKAVFRFGHTMQAVAASVVVPKGMTTYKDRDLIPDGTAVEVFTQLWQKVAETEGIAWPKTRPWAFYQARGIELARFVQEELPKRVVRVHWGERELLYQIAPGVYELAIPDLYADVLGPRGVRRTVLDFKTADRQYDVLQVEGDEQLTDYQLAVEAHGESVEQLAFCVMVYGTAPMVQWQFASRRRQDVIDHFIHAAVGVDADIRAGRFYRDDRACFLMGRCEYIPLCFSSQRSEIEKQLKRVGPEQELEELPE